MNIIHTFEKSKTKYKAKILKNDPKIIISKKIKTMNANFNEHQ